MTYVVVLLLLWIAVAAGQSNDSCSADQYDVLGRCYFWSTDSHSWSDCRQYCRDGGADIVALETPEEHQAVVDLLLSNNAPDLIWAGGLRVNSGIYARDQWIWTTGAPLPLGPPQWLSTKPSQYYRTYNRTYMQKDLNYKFLNVPETIGYHCLCETSPDSECPSPFVDVAGLCLAFYGNQVTWDKARSLCRDQYADLVTFTSPQDHGNVARRIMALEQSDISYWIGVRDLSGTYEWLTGEQVRPDLWQPRRPTAPYKCAQLSSRHNFYAVDADWTEVAGFICQYKGF
ncbi:C-type mannose receptor 2-like [Oratosquilla oratoria]|uniref:C-type mannose receptor 2-like n=1 Tax=Oratosquilla oratoria TaxID=337810 RepID=UPI003F76DCB6